MKYSFSIEDREKIEKARKTNRDKQTEKRLQVLAIRCERKTQEEISRVTGFHRSHICKLINKYFEEGIESVSQRHYAGNRRNMSIEEETVFLEQYRKRAEQGQMLEVKEIAEAYEKKVGHSISNGQIYRVLKRHDWKRLCHKADTRRKPANRSLRPKKN